MIKNIGYDHSITELGHIQVRQITRLIDEDGTEITKIYHRHVVSPGDDVSNEDDRTKAIAAALHSPEYVTEYKAAIADEVITEVEKASLWDKIKGFFSK